MKEIGKIVSVHGVDGDLVIAHDLANQKAISKLSNLMIEIWKDSFIPFFIEEVVGVTKNDMCIKFEEVNSREEGKKLLNKKVYVFGDNEVQTNEKEEWTYLIGYQVISSQNIHIGQIHDIHTNGFQVLIELEYNNKQIQLPLHQDLIIDINKEKKTIELEIADGLLELWD